MNTWGAKKRFSEKLKRDLVKIYMKRREYVTMKAFARTQDVDPGAFARWVKLYGQENKIPLSAQGMQESSGRVSL